MKIPLGNIEKNEDLKELIELLPLLREIAEKYKKSRKRTSTFVRRKSSESKFIRSFRKKDD